MSILSILLFILTFLTYMATVAIASDLHGSDAAGNGMAQGFGFVAAMALWIFLGSLTLLASSRSGAPAWVKIAGPVAAVAAGASSLAAFNLLADNFYHSRWPMVVVAVAPLLLVVMAAWLLSPGFRDALPSPGFPIVLHAAAAILAILPWPSTIYRANHRESDLAAWAATAPQREQEAQDRERAQLHALTPQSPLRDWLEFTGRPELRDEAFEGIRQSPRRQADAEEMFRTGLNYLVMYLPGLDLEMTPVICEGSRRCLRDIARDMRRHPDDRGPIYFNDSERIWEYRDGLAWLVEHKCDCSAEIQELNEVARQYEDTPERKKFLDFLAGLRR